MILLRALAVIAFVLAASSAAEAKASVDVCNHFTKWVFVADAYYDDSRLRKNYVSTGWTKIMRNECAEVYLSATIDYIYLYVTSTTMAGGIVYLPPRKDFCVSDITPFLIGYADDERRCYERGTGVEQHQRYSLFRTVPFTQFRLPPSYAGVLDLCPGGGANGMHGVWGPRLPLTPEPPDESDDST